jgi:flagellar biosynthesis protein FlhG
VRSIAVTSGKGGVGKTNLSANLAIALARIGLRVIVFDADIGLANLDVVLGCRVHSTLQEFLSGQKSLAEIVHRGPEGVNFIPGGSGVESLFHLSESQGDRFLRELKELSGQCDILIFDTGAGLSDNVLRFVHAADEVLIVITPDPSSLSDGYAVLKALVKGNETADVGLVVNMVDSESDANRLYLHLNSVSNRFLSRQVSFAGYVRSDNSAVQFIRQRTPFVIGNPNSPASQDVTHLAKKIAGLPSTTRTDLVSRLRSMFAVGIRRPA